MKLPLLFAALVALPVQAEIFVCQDAQNKTIYQDEPCAHQTLRTLKNVPAPTLEEQALAQERIDKINETYRLRAAQTESERLAQEKQDLELERIALEKQRIELLEQQAQNERYPYPIYVNPRFKNRYGGPGFNRSPYRNFPNRMPRNPARNDSGRNNANTGNPAAAPVSPP